MNYNLLRKNTILLIKEEPQTEGRRAALCPPLVYSVATFARSPLLLDVLNNENAKKLKRDMQTNLSLLKVV